MEQRQPAGQELRDDVGSFAGLDSGGSFHQVCVLDGGGLVLPRRVDHDVAGLALLAAMLTQLDPLIKVAITRAEGSLVASLQTQPAVTLYCVSPKGSAGRGSGTGLSASKSGLDDALVLSDTLRHEHRQRRPMSKASKLTAELQVLSRDRQRVRHARVSCESRLRAVLDTCRPAPLHLLSELGQDIRLALIRAGDHDGVHTREVNR